MLPCLLLICKRTKNVRPSCHHHYQHHTMNASLSFFKKSHIKSWWWWSWSPSLRLIEILLCTIFAKMLIIPSTQIREWSPFIIHHHKYNDDLSKWLLSAVCISMRTFDFFFANLTFLRVLLLRSRAIERMLACRVWIEYLYIVVFTCILCCDACFLCNFVLIFFGYDAFTRLLVLVTSLAIKCIEVQRLLRWHNMSMWASTN